MERLLDYLCAGFGFVVGFVGTAWGTALWYKRKYL
jgi:hypothetical protein